MLSPFAMHRKLRRRKNLVQQAATAARSALFEALEERRMLSLAPLGAEFIVNNSTANQQHDPAIAMDADGDFVVAFTSFYGAYGSDYMDGVFLRRYKADGTAQGTEFLVNTFTTGNQNDVAVAMSPGGNFVVVWTGEGQDDIASPTGKGIFARRYNAAGVAQGTEFQVNTYTTGDQFAPSVAMDASGNFVVSWTSNDQDGDGTGVFARRFDSSGGSLSSEMVVNTYTIGNQQASSVAMDDSGNFVVAWESYLQESDGTDFSVGRGVYAQRYSSGSVAQGSEFRVNVFTNGDQTAPAVVMDATGNFVVAFQSYFDGDGEGINFRRYNSSGVAQGSVDVLVNTTFTGAQTQPSIAMDGAGNFMIAWTGPDLDLTGIFGQYYNAAGVKLGSEFQINTDNPGAQLSPGLAASDTGLFAAAWTGADKLTLPISQGIFGQLFDQVPPPPFPLTGSPETHINSFTLSTQDRPAIAIAGQGDIIVVWQSLGEDGDGYGIFGQRYDGHGTALGQPFRVNTTTEGDQKLPAVAANNTGGFIVVWQGPDADGLGVYGRLYNNLGQAQGNEFLVNTYTEGHQSHPDVAATSAGDFIVAWQSFGQDESDYGIYARRYSLVGTPQASEFQVNSYTTGSQTAPAIGFNATGGFVIAWQSDGQDTDGEGVYARRFNSSATAVATEFIVNTTTTGDQFDPDVAVDADGNFVVVWTNEVTPGTSRIMLRQFDTRGLPTGSEVLVNNGTVNGTDPAVAMDAQTNYVVTWQAGSSSEAGDGDKAGIKAQRYNGDGTPRGLQISVNSNTVDDQTVPAIASSAVGDIAIVWTDALGDDLTDEAIVGKRLEHLTSSIVTGGAPFQINTYTTGNQFNSSVAFDDDGDFIVVWQSFNQPGDSSYGVYGQRFDAAGNRIGTEFHINTITTGNQQNPVVAKAFDGSFIVAWQSSNATLGNSIDIVARRYGADGQPLGTEFLVNSYTTGIQLDPAIAIEGGNDMVGDGDFVIVWRSFAQDASNYGVYAQRYLASGDTAGTEFQVNTYTLAAQSLPVVAMDDTGNFVVAWQSFNQAGAASGFDIYARRYDSVGVATSLEFLVNTYTTGAQSNASISMRATGEFIIAWDSQNEITPTSGLDVFARVYDNAAVPNPVGGAFQVNTYTTSDQRLPAVAIDDSGNFSIVWASRFQDGELYGIYTQRYNSAGVVVGVETQVNVFTTQSQFSPAVAMDANGDILVTWQSGGNQDGSQYGVFGRRYTIGGVNPAVFGKNFVWQNGPQRLEFIVDRDVSASLGTDDLILENLTTSTTFAPADLGVTFVFSTDKIVFTFPTSPNGGALPDGQYRARLKGSQVTDAMGNSIGPDQIIEFYFVNGDANHDGLVNPYDLVALATHWQQPSSTNYTFGDFNYDGIVDATDLAILAGKWGSGSLPPVGPLVLGSQFVWLNGPQRIEINVDRDVQASLDSGDIVLENLSTATTVSPVNIAVNWVPVSNTIVFTFSGFTNGGSLPNGRYRATLVGSGVTDANSDPIQGDHVLEFFFLNGDANHDGTVNLYDLVALSTHWMESTGVDYSSGDFNYDGVVNATDLAILSQNWQVSLANLAPALPAAPTSTTLPPTAAALPQEPPPAALPERAPVRTPTKVTSAAAVSEPIAIVTTATPPVVQEAVIITEPAAVPALEAGPTPLVETEVVATPTPVAVVVTSATPLPSPITIIEQTPPPVIEAPAPAPEAPPQASSPFASTPQIQAEPQSQPPPRRTPARTPLRATSLVDL